MIEYPSYKSLGMPVSEVTVDMVTMAKETGEEIWIDFNGIKLVANSKTSATELAKFYMIASEQRRKAYLASPEYAESQRQYEIKEKQRKEEHATALAKSPEKMSIIDLDSWNLFCQNNSDGYGAAVVRYADLWARIMEGEISRGETIAECADRTSHVADIEGITGHMYGFALQLLIKVWKHGEELKQWHNREKRF